MGLFALWYMHSPEGQHIVQGMELRALLAGAGVLAAYVVLRLWPSQGQSVRAWLTWGAVLRLAAGGLTAAGLWLAVDLLRGEAYLYELCAALPSLNENATRWLVLVGCGWAGWAVALSELFRRLGSTRQPEQAEPTAAPPTRQPEVGT
jgi:hypothetical protein